MTCNVKVHIFTCGNGKLEVLKESASTKKTGMLRLLKDFKTLIVGSEYSDILRRVWDGKMSPGKASLRGLFFKNLAIHHGGRQLWEEMEVVKEVGGSEIQTERAHR